MSRLYPVNWVPFRRRKPEIVVYVGWAEDPTRTFLIQWHTESGSQLSIVEYRKKGTQEWLLAQGSSRPYPGADRAVHWCNLKGLAPDRDYEIRLSNAGQIYTIRTMPSSLSTPIKLAFGGDLHAEHGKYHLMASAIAMHDPNAIVITGDWAYDNGLLSNVDRWLVMWDELFARLRDSEGRLIPLIPGIGNHEVAGGFGREKEDAPFFYAFFGWPQKGYGVLDFRNYLSLVILDSGHTNRIDSQVRWLNIVMQGRKNVTHVIPTYHVSSYPGYYPFSPSGEAAAIRREWHPTFDKYGVRFAMGHHDHTWMRTVPIKAGQEDPDGTIYLGGGCWGTDTRDVYNPATTWYLADAKGRRFKEGAEPHPDDGQPADPDNANHVWLLTLSETELKAEAVNIQGEVFDEIVRSVS